MTAFRPFTASTALCALTGLTLGCAAQPQPPEAPTAVPPGAVQMANPASTYCVRQGGRVTIHQHTRGGQIGMCTLPDGTVIEEWTLFRRDHPAGEIK